MDNLVLLRKVGKMEFPSISLRLFFLIVVIDITIAMFLFSYFSFLSPTAEKGLIDLDKDGHYSDSGKWGDDCNDEDPNIGPFAEEVCDGVDNNCDDVVDEGCSCAEGETRACGLSIGACKQGVQKCGESIWGICVNAVLPGIEICGNGIDENCDGVDLSCDGSGGGSGGGGGGGGGGSGGGGSGTACGNNVVETGEECDDGNTNNDDGCSSTCKLERGVVLSYEFGGDTVDSSGYDNHGILFGGTFVNDSQKGSVLSLGGSGYVEAEHSESLNISSNVTLTVWIKPTSIDPFARIITKSHTSNTAPWMMYGLSFGSSGGAMMGIGSDGVLNIVNSFSVIPVSKWTFIVGIYDGNELRIYVNGNLNGSFSYDGSIDTNTMPLTVGRSGYGTDYFRGLIDDVRVYNSVLSAEDIMSLYLSVNFCGNGDIEGNEQCDDGNINSGDGCSSSCVTEYCGDNITQSGLGEECDGSDDATCNGEVCLGNCVCDDGSGAVCGNGVCESGENGVNCPSDCGSPVTGMVGINFHWVADWSPSSPFVDVFKQSRNFMVPPSNYACVDQYGWPTEAPCNGATPITYLMTVGTWPSGAYTLKTSGTGTIQVTGRGINQQFTSPGTYTLNLSQGSILSMRFLTSSVSDPIHEVHLFLPGYANAGEHDLNPHFVDQWDEFKVTRLLNFYNALSTPVEKWSDRRLLTEETSGFSTNGPAQARKGVPPEYTYMYANAANSDVWITIPHKVNPDEQLDENYPKQLAIMLKNNLNPNLRVWVEYSNELWNQDFAAYNWIDDAAVAKWGSNCVTGSQYCRHDYVVWASAKMWEIFEDELGSDRVVKVLPGWAAPGNYNQLLVSRLDNNVLNPNNVRPDVLTIAPYLNIFVDARRNPSPNDFVMSGCYLEPNAVDIVLDMLQNAINGTSNNHPSCPGYSSTRPIMKNYLPAHVALAKDNGMELVAYESGQGLISDYPGNASIEAALNSIFTAVNRHPRMEQVYKSYYDTWFDLGGSTANHLGNIAAPGSYGYWGLLEWEWQDPSGTPYAPKWFAVQDYLG